MAFSKAFGVNYTFQYALLLSHPSLALLFHCLLSILYTLLYTFITLNTTVPYPPSLEPTPMVLYYFFFTFMDTPNKDKSYIRKWEETRYLSFCVWITSLGMMISRSVYLWISSFFGNHHSHFRTGCTGLHSHQQWVSVLLCTHLCQHQCQRFLWLVSSLSVWFVGLIWYLRTYLFALAILTGGEVKYESNFNFYFPDG